MPSDFTQSMAEMIARARPQQAPGQSHPAIAHGGGVQAKETQVNVGVDVGAIARLFGYKTDEEKAKIMSDLRLQLEQVSDDDRQKILSQKPTQKLLEGMYKAGGYGIILDESSQYTVPKMSEKYLLQQGKLSAADIAAGGAGPQARQNLINSEKAIRGFSETDILSGQAPGATADQYIENKRRLQEPTQLEKDLLQMKIETERSTNALRQKELELTPQEFELKTQESKARLEALKRDQLVSDRQIEQIKLQTEQLRRGMDPATQASLRGIEDSFSGFVQAWMQKNAMLPDNESNAFRANAELASAAMQYVSGMKAYTPNPQMAEPAVRRWFTSVKREFDRPAIKGKAQILGMGIPGTSGAGEGEQAGSQQAAAEQAARRRYYLKTGYELLQTSGSKSPDMIRDLLMWGDKQGLSDDELLTMLSGLGLSAQEQTSIINTLGWKYE
jgi:hypothetical protein